jgi:hypothetical protein
MNPFRYRSTHFDVLSEDGVDEADVIEVVDQLEAALVHIFDQTTLDMSDLEGVQAQLSSESLIALTLAGTGGKAFQHLMTGIPPNVDYLASGDQRVEDLPPRFFPDSAYEGFSWPAASHPVWQKDYFGMIRHALANAPLSTRLQISKDVAENWVGEQYERFQLTGQPKTVEELRQEQTYKDLNEPSTTELGLFQVCLADEATPIFGTQGGVQNLAMYLGDIPQIRGSLGLTRIVRHELVHVIQQAMNPIVSNDLSRAHDRWFDEGVAEYIATRRVKSPRNQINPTHSVRGHSDPTQRNYTWAIGLLVEELDNPLTALSGFYLGMKEEGSFYIRGGGLPDECPDNDEYCAVNASDDPPRSNVFFSNLFEKTFLGEDNQALSIDSFRTYIDNQY